MRSNSKQQYYTPNQQEVKNKIFKLVEQENDQFLLNEILNTLNNLVQQGNVGKRELSPVNVRYKEVLANKEREQWALEWLIGR